MTRGRVVVVAAGGTIASRARPRGGWAAGPEGRRLVAALHDRGATGGPEVELVELRPVNSFAMTHRDLRLVAEATHDALARQEVAGVVVTHGTDTLEETAAFLAAVHDDPRPVVLTGAQRPADHPEPDGPGNLAQAVALAAGDAGRDRGVLAVMGGSVLPAWGLVKAHTCELRALASTLTEQAPGPPRPLLPRATAAFDAVDVPVVTAHVGADGTLLRAAVDAGADGVLVVGTGLGNVGPALLDAVRHALEDGVAVGVSTRVWRGPLRPVYTGGGAHDLVGAGGVLLGLPASQARVLVAMVAAGAAAGSAAQALRTQARRWPGWAVVAH